jgi:phage-related minor tail protein
VEAEREFDAIAKAGEQAAESIGGAFSSSLSGAVTQWTSFEDLLKNIANSVTSIVIQTAIKTGVSALFAGANGGVFGPGGITPFASGGIVNGPTMFPFASGVGVMGEAGPEAVMPLSRGADGRLGVQSTGQNIEIVKNGSPIRVSAQAVPGGTRLTIDDMRAVDAYLGQQMATGGGTHYRGLQSAFQLTRRTA